MSRPNTFSTAQEIATCARDYFGVTALATFGLATEGGSASDKLMTLSVLCAAVAMASESVRGFLGR